MINISFTPKQLFIQRNERQTRQRKININMYTMHNRKDIRKNMSGHEFTLIPRCCLSFTLCIIYCYARSYTNFQFYT